MIRYVIRNKNTGWYLKDATRLGVMRDVEDINAVLKHKGSRWKTKGIAISYFVANINQQKYELVEVKI